MRGAADAAGKDAGKAFDRLDRRLVVDKQGGGPVAARHDAGQIHHQAAVDAGEIDVSKWPSSMRMPAQVWHRLSVGG